ncbi:hypothetical protein VSX61_20970 [Brenneria populi subsp. brevivirga]|uniref:hypothetical protein n=1 Tax=Brenneria populi TaxID=1505588 RepID=UPI002E185640|nr:hypothetical protein [Brenneria populi subsp. brevivirga]
MSAEIRFTSYELEHLLFCPHCKGSCLHQGKIEVFERQEDDKEGTHVVVDGSAISIDKNLTGNPSIRRHGLKIHFSCENCNNNPIMSIYQHKGETLMTFI